MHAAEITCNRDNRDARNNSPIMCMLLRTPATVVTGVTGVIGVTLLIGITRMPGVSGIAGVTGATRVIVPG